MGVLGQTVQSMPEAMRALVTFRSRGGLLPSRPYLAWRTATAYGTPQRPERRDVVAFLLWRRGQRRLQP